MLRRILLVVAISFAAVMGAWAQGSIAGVIKDATTGEAVIGANVIVQGTSFGASTDIEGKFTIPKVPAGTYNLQVSFVTYKPHTVPNVVVTDGKRTTIDIPLSENVSELAEVVVTGTRAVDTDIDLVNTIKEAKLVVVGISGEQISRSLDRDAAQVIRRVPGVTVKEDQFVVIRGLSERYNVVMLHNAYAPSVETDVRSFSFATLPSNQLDRMLVFKSPSADLPADFGGGVVKIFTKSIPDENSLVLDYSTQVRLGTTFQSFSAQEHNNLQFTAFNDHYYNLPNSFPANVNTIQNDALVSTGQSLKNLWTPKKTTAIPDQRLNLTFNRKFTIGNVQVGNISAITYSNSFQQFSVERNDYNSYNTSTGQSAPIYRFADEQYNQNIRTGFLFNWAFKFNENHNVEFKNLYNQSSADQYVSRYAEVYESGSLQQNASFNKIYRGIYSGQLLGAHSFFNKRTTVEWVAGYNKTYRDQPDYKRYRSDLDPDTKAPQIYIGYGVSPNFLGRYFGRVNEDSKTGGFSIKQTIGSATNPLRNIEVKAGVFYEAKDRDFKQRNIGYVKASASFDQSLLSLPIDQFFAPENINNTTGIQIAEQSQKRDNYTASNRLLAYYGKVTVPLGKFNFDGGVRIEDNEQKLDSYNLNGSPINPDYKITRVLPSVNLSYNFTEKMLVRVAYGQTLNRPEFRELAPLTYFDFNFNFLYAGNEFLQTAKIQNIDLRWELYPSKGELITAGLFYKDFTNPIEVVLQGGSGGGVKNATFENAESAKSYGVEVEIKKNLSGLTSSAFLNDLSVLLNASIIKSEVELPASLASGQEKNRPLQGQAPYVVNAALYYNHEATGWQVNMLYNIVGRSISFVGNVDYPNLYTMPRNVLDLTFSKRLTEHFLLKGGISDLINQPVMILQDGNKDKKFDRKNDQIIQSYRPGQVFSLGFSYTLN